jgi:tetratricopeptide (TPR) repeat protein
VAVWGDDEASSDQERLRIGDEMLDRLASLASKNCIRTENSAIEEPRFSILPTIREYAEEQLDKHEERGVAQRRFVQFLLSLAQTDEPHLYGFERDVWIDRLERESINLRAALTWCRENANQGETGLELAAALSMFWLHRGYLRDGLSWLEAMLKRTTQDSPRARGRALFGASILCWKQGETAAGASYAQAAVAILREEDQPPRAYASLLLALCWISLGRVEEARALLIECLKVFKESKSHRARGLRSGFLPSTRRLGGSRSRHAATVRRRSSSTDKTTTSCSPPSYSPLASRSRRDKRTSRARVPSSRRSSSSWAKRGIAGFWACF